MSDENKDDKIKRIESENHALSSNNKKLHDLLHKDAERTPLFGAAYPHHNPVIHHQLVFNQSRKAEFDPICGWLKLWSGSEYIVVCRDEMEDFIEFVMEHKDDYPVKRKATTA